MKTPRKFCIVSALLALALSLCLALPGLAAGTDAKPKPTPKATSNPDARIIECLSLLNGYDERLNYNLFSKIFHILIHSSSHSCRLYHR